MGASRASRVSLLAFSLLAACAAHAQVDYRAELEKARATDPITLGWMQGSPPPPEKMLRYEDDSFNQFPQLRWSLSHWRQFRPTVNVSRGSGAVVALPRAERNDIDALTFTPIGGKEPLTWADSLTLNYTDGIVILHRGRIVYERYFGALTAEKPHNAYSVTKSYFGTLAAMLIAEGKLDPAAPVSRYLPELATSGFGDATVQQLLDMTTAIDFVENYATPSVSMQRFRKAAGYLPQQPGDESTSSLYAFLPTIAKAGTHGERFTYRTPNVDALYWVITRVTGKSPEVLLSERIWSQLGAEGDAYIAVDPAGTPLVGTALNTRLRDNARFGELMRLGGKWGGRQVVPAKVVEDIRGGASAEKFKPAGYATLPGWSYHNFWWVSHDDHGVFMARGIRGQAIYIDPKAEMVIARYASHHISGNAGIDPLSLPAYRAVAEHLMKRK
jgi:CubicO group peptidase (beta-lactamase class C family)